MLQYCPNNLHDTLWPRSFPRPCHPRRGVGSDSGQGSIAKEAQPSDVGQECGLKRGANELKNKPTHAVDSHRTLTLDTLVLTLVVRWQCGVSKEIFDKAMVTTLDEALASAARIGYPVMLKASEGGGGKVRPPTLP